MLSHVAWLNRGSTVRCLTRGCHVVLQEGDDDDFAEEEVEEEEGERVAGPVGRSNYVRHTFTYAIIEREEQSDGTVARGMPK